MINFSCMKDLVDLVKTEQKTIADIMLNTKHNTVKNLLKKSIKI